MSAPAVVRLVRRAGVNAARWSTRSRPTGQLQTSPSRAGLLRITTQSPRCFSTTTRRPGGLMPDTHDPQPPNRVEESRVITQPTELEDEEYHAIADEYMDAVHEKAEAMQDAREDFEVEYSAGVLSISNAQAGTYIINKQPPNKQIWLSSPQSGPKRYDWVLHGESMDQKEGGGVGDWIYLRDGTSLTDLLRKELGIEIDLHGHEEHNQELEDKGGFVRTVHANVGN